MRHSLTRSQVLCITVQPKLSESKYTHSMNWSGPRLVLCSQIIHTYALTRKAALAFPVGVSRQFDFYTSKQIGITSRPGFDELDNQLDRIKQLHGSTFGIIEDDIYTGGTLKYMIGLLNQHGINVTDVVGGISSTDHIDMVPIRAAAFYQRDSLLELTDPRDYVFGAKDGGLVVTYGGRKCRVPYDQAFVDIVSRSSLAQHHVMLFTRLIRAANWQLHSKLNSLHTPASLVYSAEILCHAGFSPAATIGDLCRM